MSRAKQKKKINKQVTGLVLFLISIQVVFIAYFNSKPKALTASQAIDNAVSTISDPRRKEQARVYAAVKSFQRQYDRLPASLNELIPVYFERIPLDPLTSKPFDYTVEGSRFFVGREATPQQKDKKVTPEHAKALTGELLKITEMIQKSNNNSYVYNPTGKRDPFLPFDLAPKIDLSNKSPLERFSLGQLKLTAVLKGFPEPQAIVETANGKGYTIKKGTKIGTDNGEVVDIQDDKLIIVESTVDFTGEKKNRTVELKLNKKDVSEKE